MVFSLIVEKNFSLTIANVVKDTADKLLLEDLFIRKKGKWNFRR